MGSSLAFKCIYNDGDEGLFVGFAGTCSSANIDRNVRAKRVWCSEPSCDCRKYFDQNFEGKAPVKPCMESRLFREWRFGAGYYHRGANHDQPIHFSEAEVGKLAFLTTRFPNEPESERRIIGLFRIAEIVDRNTVVAAPIARVRLPLDEAKELYFWAYCTTKPKKPTWGTHLFRYVDDGQAHRILTDIAVTVRDEPMKEAVHVLIQSVFGNEPAPAANGCLPERSRYRDETIAARRKYGPGGEGPQHKAPRPGFPNIPRRSAFVVSCIVTSSFHLNPGTV